LSFEFLEERFKYLNKTDFLRLRWVGNCSIFKSGQAEFTMSSATLNPGEETQLLQTIEMFEVIVQSQPNDCQSLEILKEAYTKLGREADVIRTSKRIAEAYTQMGQLSSAILEYETVLQRRPNDEDVQTALKRIEDTANNAASQSAAEPAALAPLGDGGTKFKKKARGEEGEIDDGQKTMRKLFVESKLISAGDFELCWRATDLTTTPTDAIQPFIQTLHDKNIYQIEKSLRLLTDKSRTGFLPLERYDVDMELLRGFPADVCRRWCVAPFDRMSKAILVATANPFNQQAAKELSEATSLRLLWYLVMPSELLTLVRKAFR
jgi:tetratricopeptide (TPR) repeat protein